MAIKQCAPSCWEWFEVVSELEELRARFPCRRILRWQTQEANVLWYKQTDRQKAIAIDIAIATFDNAQPLQD